jgi:hypothetical protein
MLPLQLEAERLDADRSQRQHQVVSPGQSSNSLLDDFGFRPSLDKGKHVFEDR